MFSVYLHFRVNLYKIFESCIKQCTLDTVICQAAALRWLAECVCCMQYAKSVSAFIGARVLLDTWNVETRVCKYDVEPLPVVAYLHFGIYGCYLVRPLSQFSLTCGYLPLLLIVLTY